MVNKRKKKSIFQGRTNHGGRAKNIMVIASLQMQQRNLKPVIAGRKCRVASASGTAYA
jgi:hypothetical protein